LVEAAAWFRKAAEQGVARAQFHLGFCYECGEGVQRDKGQAAIWYRRAADQGDGDAKTRLSGIYASGKVRAQ
jgi:TPR repeat protein